jgi:hypothetical protein
MTVKQMEQRLIELSQTFRRTRDESLRDEYRVLHVEWMAAKR